jgi:lysine 2,3-aminomutase
VSKGLEIIEYLRGHTSGYAIPTFVVDAPGGGGKIPLSPNYVIAQTPSKTVLRNFEGVITSYPDPEHYHPHDSENCEYCQQAGDQLGVAALLSDQRINLEPKQLTRELRRKQGEVLEKR